MPNWSFQVSNNKRAEETGVEGFAGRPLRLWLPHLQAARRPHGGHGGNHLAEDACSELADLPQQWSVDASEIGKETFTREEEPGNCVEVFNSCYVLSLEKSFESFKKELTLIQRSSCGAFFATFLLCCIVITNLVWLKLYLTCFVKLTNNNMEI